MNKFKKTIAGLTAVAFVLSLVVVSTTSSKAAMTTAELEAQIQTLMAQLSAVSAPSSAPAASYNFTRSLTLGASGSDVTALQNFLIGKGYQIPAGATGFFGGQTQSAVIAFQRAKAITPASGYFGPVTQAAVASMMANDNTTGGTPANPGTTPTPPVTTSTSTNPSTSNDGPLEGGAGDLETADFVASLNNEEVGEDSEDVKIAGLELEADENSDLEVTSVKLAFEEQAAGGDQDFDEYAEKVTIWFDGKEVGSADVDEFNEDSDRWTKSISVDGVVIRAGEKEDLIVAVTSQGSIDTANLGTANNDWEVSFESIRYEDADGAVVTENSLDDIGSTDARSFFFDTFASSNDVELKLSKASNNPEEKIVTVDEDGGDEIVLAEGQLKAEGSDIEVKEILATIIPGGTGDASEIATQYTLRIDGEDVDSVDSDECEVIGDCDGSGTATAVEYVFNDDIDFTIEEGKTVKFQIVAELDEISATFVEGDSLRATVDASDIEAEDETGEELLATELSGSLSGKEQTFFSEGIVVDNIKTPDVKVTFTADDTGETSVAEYVVEFSVTANETEIYLDKSTDGSGTSGTAGEGIVYTVDSSATASAVSAKFECVSSCGESADNTVDEFFIEEGDTETYRLTVTVTGDTTPTTADFKVWVDSINWSTTDLGAADQIYSSNLGEDSDADTGFKSIIAL